ncbi:MAG: hypothetical protein CM15mP44_9340 [Candidatus Neomarinimicrobiota bacterium]|nr:MAG: hypothetical protein CM15mP44_9340 [Candidatus Neomarinimicrobiota bacterium]
MSKRAKFSFMLGPKEKCYAFLQDLKFSRGSITWTWRELKAIEQKRALQLGKMFFNAREKGGDTLFRGTQAL